MKIQFFNIREKGKLEVDDFKITLQLKKKTKYEFLSSMLPLNVCKKNPRKGTKKRSWKRGTRNSWRPRGVEGEKEAEVGGSITRGEREREREGDPSPA